MPGVTDMRVQQDVGRTGFRNSGVFIVEVLNFMGPSDAEITYEFHSALPLNDADAFFLGELA